MHRPNQQLDSNGPEGRVRGTASHIYERYLIQARDAQMGGDNVLAENLYQHAEHYFRVLNLNGQANPQANQSRPRSDADLREDDEEDEDENVESWNREDGRQNDGRQNDGRQNDGRQNDDRRQDGRNDNRRSFDNRQDGRRPDHRQQHDRQQNDRNQNGRQY